LINPNAIDGIGLEIVLESIFQTLTTTKQNDEHKDAPEHTESSKNCSQLVLGDCTENLLPSVG
jgi:hypothetical protein